MPLGIALRTVLPAAARSAIRLWRAERPRLHGYPSRAAVVLLIVSLLGHGACGAREGSPALPGRLSNAEFWGLVTRLSEAGGGFDAENLVSNELRFVHTARLLRPRGGVYIGVGPEQNFSYIAKLRPQMAFIVDIREQNRNLHLMYKALFELSRDRLEFLGRLFSRDRPTSLRPGASVHEIFAALDRAATDTGRVEADARSIRDHLVLTHQFPLTEGDVHWIEYALRAFARDGPDISYGRSHPTDAQRPSYRELMTARDISGKSHSYLATEEGFAFVKDLQSRNLVVPVVGDFAGPTALRAIGDYVRQQRATVEAFYGSNVEVYLNRQQTHGFCRNLASLPFRSGTWFIWGKGMQPLRTKLQSCQMLLP